MSTRPHHASALQSEDKRRYFRIEDYVALKLRPLSDEEVTRFVEDSANRDLSGQSLAGTFAASTRQMDYVLRRIKEDDPDIAAYLVSLNEKLDLLARALSQDDDELSEAPVRKIDLSAAGVSVPNDAEIRPGTTVEIKMLMYPSLLHVVTLGEVVRCEAVRDPKSGFKFRIAADFKHLRDETRELLIHHITQKQSSLLRERRTDSDTL